MPFSLSSLNGKHITQAFCDSSIEYQFKDFDKQEILENKKHQAITQNRN